MRYLLLGMLLILFFTLGCITEKGTASQSTGGVSNETVNETSPSQIGGSEENEGSVESNLTPPENGTANTSTEEELMPLQEFEGYKEELPPLNTVEFSFNTSISGFYIELEKVEQRVGKWSQESVWRFRVKPDEGYELRKVEGKVYFNNNAFATLNGSVYEGNGDYSVTFSAPSGFLYIRNMEVKFKFAKTTGENRVNEKEFSIQIPIEGSKEVKLYFLPKQCQQYPWEGNIVDYYSEANITEVKHGRAFDVVCMACNVCPRGDAYIVVPTGNITRMLEDGWKVLG